MLLINYLEQDHMRYRSVEIINKNENLGINVPSYIWLKLIKNDPNYHYLKYMVYDKKEYDNKTGTFKLYLTSDFRENNNLVELFSKLSNEEQFDILRKYYLK